MGVDLNVWSNHKLQFSSHQEGIDKFERLTSKKIKQWNFKTDKPLEKTRDIAEVEYFSHFEILNHNFDNWNQIRIWTNYEFCDELTLFKQTFKLHPTKFKTRYSKWQQLVADEYKMDDEYEIQKMKLWRKDWLQFRGYAHQITKTLNGDMIIYLNDHGYQNEEDLFFQGSSLEEGMNKLSESAEPLELEYLALFPNDIRATTTWHYDRI